MHFFSYFNHLIKITNSHLISIILKNSHVFKTFNIFNWYCINYFPLFVYTASEKANMQILERWSIGQTQINKSFTHMRKIPISILSMHYLSFNEPKYILVGVFYTGKKVDIMMIEELTIYNEEYHKGLCWV